MPWGLHFIRLHKLTDIYLLYFMKDQPKGLYHVWCLWNCVLAIISVQNYKVVICFVLHQVGHRYVLTKANWMETDLHLDVLKDIQNERSLGLIFFFAQPSLHVIFRFSSNLLEHDVFFRLIFQVVASCCKLSLNLKVDNKATTKTNKFVIIVKSLNINYNT